MNDDEEYAYGMDISVLKFINPIDITDTTDQDYPSIYDSTAKTITYEKAIPNYVYIATNSYTFYINSRGGYMKYAIYLNGDEEVETHNPLFVNNNCEKTSEDYYICDDAIYYGDTIDTEDIVENILAKIFNLADYTLTSVKIVPPTANLNLTTDTDTVKKGTALADAGFTLEFYFDLDEDVKTPDTGFFTANNKGLIAGISTITLSMASIIVYLSHYLVNRQKAKVKFNKD